MPSLSQILRERSPLLLIDAASATVQVGLLDVSAPARWSSRTEEAGVGVFECLDDLGVEIGLVRSFAFCEAPGSILGIRTSAMAIRTWNILGPRPTFAYVALAGVAHAVGRPQVGMIADARRGPGLRFARSGCSERVTAAGLSGERMTPEGFRDWEPLPPHTAPTSYGEASPLAHPRVAD